MRHRLRSAKRARDAQCRGSRRCRSKTRYHKIALLINLMNISAVTIFLARVVVLCTCGLRLCYILLYIVTGLSTQCSKSMRCTTSVLQQCLTEWWRENVATLVNNITRITVKKKLNFKPLRAIVVILADEKAPFQNVHVLTLF